MIDFEGFYKREEELKKITRFGMYKPMFYRTNLAIHPKRVYFIVNDLVPLAKEVFRDEFNEELAKTLALVHDDAEIITGDIQLGYKIKMTKEELAKLDEEEKEAIEKLAEMWPEKINGVSYKRLLYHALHKDCIEAQLVSFADKLDAYCESLHELYAGNELFSWPVEVYTGILLNKREKFPLISRLFDKEHPLLDPPKQLDRESIIKKGKPHDKESINNKTGSPHYNFWKKLTITNFGESPLIQKLE